MLAMRIPSLLELSTRSLQLGWAKLESFESIREAISRRDQASVRCNDAKPSLDGLNLIVPWPAEELRRIVGAVASVEASGVSRPGYFELLGYGSLNFGDPVDWHLEATTGKRCPMLPWKQLDNLDSSLTGEKKVVWELNRHQFLLSWARQYWLDGDERLAERVCEHVKSWIRENPVGMGINWVSSLELAFRSISWLWAFAILQQSETWAKEDKAVFVGALGDHAGHIARHLSLYSSPNTHLTGEALALYFIGNAVPELRQATAWRQLGRTILLRELPKHVLADGVYFERTTWYHRYTFDFYMHFLLLASRSGDILSHRVANSVQLLADHLMWITRPDGTSPSIGDDDGGRLFPICRAASDDWRVALCNAAIMFKRRDFRYVAGSFSEESSWLFGAAAREQFEQIQSDPPTANSKAFPHGGYFVMRSGWDRDANYLVLDCGPHGVMNCGHAHSDALAIEVSGQGRKHLIDPGTYVYSSDAPERDLFRHGKMHNTLTIDGQSASVTSGPFKWSHVARPRLECWHDQICFTFARGFHDGFARLPDPVIHRRSVLFPMREYWVVLDELTAAGPHTCDVNWQLAHEASAKETADGQGFMVAVGGVDLSIIACEAGGSWSVRDSWVSPVYGARMPSKSLNYQFEFSVNASVLSLLLPGQPQKSAAIVRNLASSTGKCIGLDFGEKSDVLLHSSANCAAAAVSQTDCEWVWGRFDTGSAMLERLFCLHGRRIQCAGIGIESELMFSQLVAVRDGEMLTIAVGNCGLLIMNVPDDIVGVEINGRRISMGEGNRASLQPAEYLVDTGDVFDTCAAAVN